MWGLKGKKEEIESRIGKVGIWIWGLGLSICRKGGGIYDLRS